ncbi:DUF4870 domain-containing protein [Protaetiibacter intestinalis]|uniref:DUF4870 domain-containing protein n=1 Tax=Protaetiibacter intestinalis TaxID=2419774 RepID=A0A387B3J1_9MICO|nr:DUF4870 domain-containing protein [Protaetiibacter intestinalis]AYF96867.1 DUF4870 domain-containing protein [Protaetiibacter intestinalis]
MTDPAQPAPQPQPAAPLTEAEDKQWASFAHLGGILGPLPALIIWLVFKERGPKTSVEGKEALNWQITFVIGWVVLIILSTIISAALAFSGAWAIAGLFSWLPFLLWVVNIVFSILGFVKVNGGGSYRYPFALRLIK